MLAEADERASETQRIAEVYAEQTRAGADEKARAQIDRARALSAEVLQDGTEMSHNLRQLSESLRRNAELILRDVTTAHRSMSERLAASGVEPERPAAGARRSRGTGDAPFGDVPEFLPEA